MKKKEKGYALLLTLVVVMLLSTLAVCILQVATVNYIATLKNSSNNSLRIEAESGVEKGTNMLKDYVLKDNEAADGSDSPLINPSQITGSKLNDLYKYKGGLNYTDNGINCTITFFSGDSPDVGDSNKYTDENGRSLNYIKIKAVASKNGKTKTAEAYIDRDDYSNIYYDRLFGDKSAFTVANNNSQDVKGSFTLNNPNVKLSLEGNMYLQGHNINIYQNYKPKQGDVALGDGNIYVKSDNFDTILTNLKSTNIDPIGTTATNLYKDSSSYGNMVNNGWKNKSIYETDLLKIKDSDAADPIQPDDNTIEDDSSFVVIQKSVNPNSNYTSLITYKINPNNVQGADFQKIVNGNVQNSDNAFVGTMDVSGDEYTYNISGNTNGGLYQTIIDRFKTMYPNYNENDFGSLFKFIIVDGNLNIDDDKIHNYDNYVIYCTGKVTFNGAANFYNSSIFANSIEFDENANSQVNFYGINTTDANEHKVTNSSSSLNFDDDDKRFINQYLINNLEDYGKYIKFKTLKWVEK
ncbi:MAG: hypothetical protein PHX70_10175 [Clostridium sp.]|nr:hypothetical protein [Clostridium sp.]